MKKWIARAILGLMACPLVIGISATAYNSRDGDGKVLGWGGVIVLRVTLGAIFAVFSGFAWALDNCEK